MASEPLPLTAHAASVAPPRARTLAAAVLETLAYADVFDHPLTATEVHRDLVGLRATAAEVVNLLARERRLVCVGGMYALPGRQGIAALRRRRERAAAGLWPRARSWGRALATLPFVRMVAVTGALAVDCADPGADIDYLIVAASGRVWTCRLMVTALARVANLRGPALCPNYLLSEGALAIRLRNLYTAHELAQMVPLAGGPTYRRMIETNAWTEAFLPNVATGRAPTDHLRAPGGRPARLVEWLLGGSLGTRLEERLRRLQSAHLQRKIDARRLAAGEAAFAAEAYKGHFDAHGERIIATWNSRLRALGEARE